MRLAEKGFDVIASVEIYSQVQPLKRAAAARGVKLHVEKLDVTNDGDRRKALGWNVEILVNNAGLLEGGSVVDIPAAKMAAHIDNYDMVLIRNRDRKLDRCCAIMNLLSDLLNDQQRFRGAQNSRSYSSRVADSVAHGSDNERVTAMPDLAVPPKLV